jgi:acetate kinase
MNILTLNCGSSSVKYQLYSWEKKLILAYGMVERVGIAGSFIKHTATGERKTKKEFDCPDHFTAVQAITSVLIDPEYGALSNISEINAVGHRVVHGGEKFAHSVIIDKEAIATFKDLASLAPLHNPPNIIGIEAAQLVLPDVPHCAVMDTAWHQTIQAPAYIYALPYRWYTQYGIRRYGFHGTSFLYVAKRAAVLLDKDPFAVNLICLHIGNGASVNAVKNGISYDTSLGFTPLEGLVMGTRAGDHDAAIDLYIMEKEGLTPKDMETLLNKKSGVLGITEKYVDRRDVLEAASRGEEPAKLAIDIESYRMKKYIGSYYAALGRVDAIVFTAGVGELGWIYREKSLSGLEELGIKIDLAKNTLSMTRNLETEISTPDSKVKVYVIPTDEELVMTEDTYALMSGVYDVHTKFRYSFQNPQYVNYARKEAFEKECETKPELCTIAAKKG